MTKQEFLEELKSALSGEVSAEVMLDSYRYYSNYIEEGIRSGETEEDITNELGKPMLIARSIIAANSRQRMADVEYTEDGKTRMIKNEKINHSSDKKFTFRLNSWYAIALLILIAIPLLFIMFLVLHKVFLLFFTIGIPILIVLGIIWLIMYLTR